MRVIDFAVVGGRTARTRRVRVKFVYACRERETAVVVLSMVCRDWWSTPRSCTLERNNSDVLNSIGLLA